MLDTASLNGHSRVAKVASFKMPAFVKAMLANVTFTTLPNGWQVAILKIDPILAAAMLECRESDHQRNLRNSVVRFYQKQLESKSWTLTHQGIAFDKKGRLIDGQHRLEASVASHEVLVSMVWFGVGHGDDEALKIDTGSNRNQKDGLAFRGMKRSTRYMAIMRMMQYHGSKFELRQTNEEAAQFEETHRKAIEFADALCTRGVKVSTAAGVARAYYYCDPDVLTDFVNVLSLEKPAVKAHEKSAILLNRFCAGLKNQGGQLGRNEVMGKTLRAIRSFVAGEKLDRLYADELSTFPLPADGKPRRK